MCYTIEQMNKMFPPVSPEQEEKWREIIRNIRLSEPTLLLPYEEKECLTTKP